jgi:hypothetical protein
MRELNPDYTPAEKEHFKDMRVMILCPCSYHYPRFWQSVVNMTAYSWGYGLRIEEIGIMERVVVHWAREELVEQAMEVKSRIDGSDITHFLWLDADHIFQPDLCLELARWDKDAVSAVYVNRSRENPKPVVYIKKEKDETGNTYFPILSIPQGLFRVDAFGFGAVLIKKDVFTNRIKKPWFKDCVHGGEDLNFCRKARESGVELWADGRYWLAHLGDPETFTLKTYENWIAQQEMEKVAAPIEMEVIRK